MVLCCLAICAVIAAAAAAVTVLVIAAPPYGAFRWLRHLLTSRYALSHAKRAQCVTIGVGCLALAFLLVGASLASAPVIGWLAATLSMFGVALFLTLAAYRQGAWRHHKAIGRIWREQTAVRRDLWRTRIALGLTTLSVRSKGFRHRQSLEELRRLDELLPSLVGQDSQFLSAERFRVQRQFAQMPYAGLQARLSELKTQLTRTPASAPRSATLLLQAGVARQEMHGRALGAGRASNWRTKVESQSRLDSAIGQLRTRNNSLQQQIQIHRLETRRLRLERVFLA